MMADAQTQIANSGVKFSRISTMRKILWEQDRKLELWDSSLCHIVLVGKIGDSVFQLTLLYESKPVFLQKQGED